MQLRALIVASATLVAVVLALVTSAAPHASSSGLVASYAFDEGTGTMVRDSTGQNAGTTRDTTWVAAGKFGGALAFNGTTSWVTIPDSAALEFTKGFTIEAWVKPAADMGTGWQTVAYKEGAGDLAYALFANSDLSAPAASAVTAARTDLRGLAPLPPNVWSHVATTWDGSTMRLYVNGTQVSSTALSGTLPVTTGALRLGGNSQRGEWFNGQIDDLRLYSQAQSASRIATDMTTPVTPPAAPPSGDITPPSTPTGLAAVNVATTSVTAAWTPSTDNVGVAGYNVFLDGLAAGTTTAPVFTFTGLACGTTHAVGVEAFDAAGNPSGRASLAVSTLACSDTTAPSAPASFTQAATSTSSITTSWLASTDNVGVAGYTLYRDGVADGTAVGSLYTFAGLACGTSYTLGVEAFDAAGNVSARTTLVAATAPCPDVTAPSAPTSFLPGTTGQTSIATSWVASTDNVGVAGYLLFRDGVGVGTTTSTLFTFAGLACATGYTLGVAAFDAAGNVSPLTTLAASTAACPDLTAPSAPTGLALASVTRTSLALSWAASTDNVGVAGYRVFRDGVGLGTTAATSFALSGLTCGTSYVLGVEAFDAAGNVSARATATATTIACPDVTPPSAPTALAAGAATTTSIPLSWTASTDNVGVTGYTLFLDGAAVGATTSTSFAFTGLACGTSHVLGVQAFDAATNVSARSSVTAATAACPDTTPPTAPSAFVAGTPSATSIPTSWSPATDNVAVAGYTVYRDGTSVATISGASVATAATVNFTFAGLACGTSYVLAVEAFDAAGNVSARPSLTASTAACADTTPPQVALSAPSAGATVSGAVRLAATASDAGGVASVQFTVDGVNVGAPATVAPYGTTWDTLAAANGSHTIAAQATDAAGNTATSAAVTVTVQNTAFDTANAFKKVDVGPGFMDAALHGVIRTAGGRVYVFAADDTPERKGIAPGIIHAYRGDQLGIPISFTEVDVAHHPSATGTTHVVGSPDVRLDRSGVAHMVYTDETNATLWYQTFSTVTDTWGPRVSLATGVDVPLVPIKRETSNALTLDANDVPHVVYAGGGVVQYRNRVGGTWSAPVTISSGGTPIHVSLVAAPDGTLDLAWLQGAILPSQIKFAQRSALGTWSAPETVAPSDVLDNSNADQGPSVAYSATNEPYVIYVSALPVSAVRVRHRAGGTWVLDPTPTDFFTHTPQIYMQGNDVYAFLGHDSQIRFAYAYHLAGQAWSPLTALTSTIDGTLDGSASVRFDPLHETNAGIIDAAFFDEDRLNDHTFLPEAYYMAVVPSGTGGTATGDLTPPAVALTAPASGATVSGPTVVSANATDNVGVVGVQFRLDGVNLGVEDTASPYTISWDTTGVPDGSHTLTAVARDAAGNTTAAAAVPVTVSNGTASPPPPPAPAPGTVLLGNGAIEAKIDSDATGEAEAFKVTAAVTGTVARLRLFVDAGSTATRIVVGLYANGPTGHPAGLLTTAAITAPVAGQNNEVAVAGAPVTAGQTYWLAVLGTGGTVKFRDRGSVGAGNSEMSGQVALTALPATWTSGASFTDGQLSAVGLG